MDKIGTMGNGRYIDGRDQFTTKAPHYKDTSFSGYQLLDENGYPIRDRNGKPLPLIDKNGVPVMPKPGQPTTAEEMRPYIDGSYRGMFNGSNKQPDGTYRVKTRFHSGTKITIPLNQFESGVMVGTKDKSGNPLQTNGVLYSKPQDQGNER